MSQRGGFAKKFKKNRSLHEILLAIFDPMHYIILIPQFRGGDDAADRLFVGLLRAGGLRSGGRNLCGGQRFRNLVGRFGDRYGGSARAAAGIADHRTGRARPLPGGL